MSPISENLAVGETKIKVDDKNDDKDSNTIQFYPKICHVTERKDFFFSTGVLGILNANIYCTSMVLSSAYKI